MVAFTFMKLPGLGMPHGSIILRPELLEWLETSIAGLIMCLKNQAKHNLGNQLNSTLLGAYPYNSVYMRGFGVVYT